MAGPATRAALAAARKPIVEPASTHTMSLADAAAYLQMSAFDAKSCIVPPHSSVPWMIGTELAIRSITYGDLTISGGAGVTITPPYGSTLVMQDGMTAMLYCVGENEWQMFGQLVPIVDPEVQP